MKRTLLPVAPTLLLAFSLALSAQDAGMVLRTSVTYNTQKATLPLTDDQRRQADELSREAQQANQAGKYGDAIRSFYQGLAVMRNVPWTPALEFVSSLQGKLDHAIVEPGAQVSVTLTPLYATPRAAVIKLNASLVLRPRQERGRRAEALWARRSPSIRRPRPSPPASRCPRRRPAITRSRSAWLPMVKLRPQTRAAHS